MKKPFQRVIDDVPHIIDNDFIRKLQPTVQEALEVKFFTDIKAADRYMAEDPEIVARREDLEAKSARLVEIENMLTFSLDEE